MHFGFIVNSVGRKTITLGAYFKLREKHNLKQNEAHSARVLILSGGKNIKLRRETVMSKLHTVRLFMEPQWQQQNGVWDE